MARPRKKILQRSTPSKPTDRLARALEKYRKAELVEFLVDLAEDENAIMRHLESVVDLDKPSEEIVVSARDAMADATRFDRREVGHNFDYDHEAYAAVARYFSKLIGAGHLELAMSLSLELMELGSYQVEVSDEGMMTEDIEDCFRVVIRALVIKGACSPADVIDWCVAMKERDRVGFICDSDLQKLRELFE